MAIINVSIGPANSGLLPIASKGYRRETINSTTSNVQGNLIAQLGDVAKINTDGPVIVNAGAAASASVGMYLAANEVVWIALAAGDRINVIDA